MTAPRFPLGNVVVTAHAQGELRDYDIQGALRRHAAGDWGVVCEDDKAANDAALRTGERLVSAYLSADQVRFLIITEWDRSYTTVLLPEDY